MGFLSDFLPSALSYIGGSQTNETNLASARQLNAFNHREAALARTFEHNEARYQRGWTAQQSMFDRRFNSREATKARRFLQIMSDTAHRREVRDLRKAGLNPILSATRGASTPGAPAASSHAGPGAKASAHQAAGAMARVENYAPATMASAMAVKRGLVEVDKLREEISNAAKTGKNLEADNVIKQEEAKEVRERIKNIRADTAKRQAEEEKLHNEAGYLGEQTQNAYQERGNIMARAKEIRARTYELEQSGELTRHQAEAVRSGLAELHGQERVSQTRMAEIMRYMERVMPTATSAVRAASPMFRRVRK